MKDLKTWLENMDLGYHISHRRNGQLMGDVATGHIKEGIGHYRSRPRADGATEIEADNPYPCAFDKGMLFGAMRVLNVVGAIYHDESLPCRKRGDRACVYIVKD